MIIGDYLARVNIVSLFPTLLLFLGFKNSFKYTKSKHTSLKKYFSLYLILAVMISFMGYLWFLISYPSDNGDTNKDTYIIHLFHLLGLMTVFKLEDLKKINYRRYLSIVFILFCIFLHNISAMMSHFPPVEIFKQLN